MEGSRKKGREGKGNQKMENYVHKSLKKNKRGTTVAGECAPAPLIVATDTCELKSACHI